MFAHGRSSCPYGSFLWKCHRTHHIHGLQSSFHPNVGCSLVLHAVNTAHRPWAMSMAGRVKWNCNIVWHFLSFSLSFACVHLQVKQDSNSTNNSNNEYYVHLVVRHHVAAYRWPSSDGFITEFTVQHICHCVYSFSPFFADSLLVLCHCMLCLQ